MRLLLSIWACLGILSTLGCSRDGSGTIVANFIPSAATGERVSEENLQLFDFVRHAFSFRATDQVAQTDGTSVTSLQYYLQSIQVCESITVNGTSYSNPTGCSHLYQDTTAEQLSLYNSFAITEAQADTTNFVDFLDEASRAKLEASASIDAGTYNYVLINYMRPVKITASFKTPGGTTVHHTKSSGTIVDGGTDEGGRTLESFQPTGTTTGSAELMTVLNSNGGTFVQLLKPFVVAEGDSVVLDFVFNPNNFATTAETATCSTPTSHPYTYDTTNCVNFGIPYAKMQPVPRLVSETTKKEIYTISNFTTGSSASDIRIEVYYNSADSNKSVRAVDTATVFKTGATSDDGGGIGVGAVSETDDVLTFTSYNESTQQNDATSLTNLTRRQSGTLTVHCTTLGGPCSTVGQTIEYAYTYDGEATVE